MFNFINYLFFLIIKTSKNLTSFFKYSTFVYFSYIIKILDKLILFIVILFLLLDFIGFLAHLFDSIYQGYYSLDNLFDSKLFMSSNDNNTATTNPIVTHNTNVSVNRDSSFADNVRDLFLIGYGGHRLIMSRTPSGRFAGLGILTLGGAFSRAINNQINDPNYIPAQIAAGKAVIKEMWSNGQKEEVIEINVQNHNTLYNNIEGAIGQANASTNMVPSAEVLENVNNNSYNVNNFLGDGNNIDSFIGDIISRIFNVVNGLLEPVTVNYSNEVLSNQINSLALLLFILTIIIIYRHIHM